MRNTFGKSSLFAIFFVLCSSTFPSCPAHTNHVIEDSIAEVADIDVNGNIYFIDSSYTIQKRNTSGLILSRQSLLSYGEGASIDASNPIEIFVFYPNSGFLLILDNNLNITKEINLSTQGPMQAASFGRANDGNIWVYDKNTHTVKKIDRRGETLMESMIIEGDESAGNGAGRVFDNGNQICFTTGNTRLVILDANAQIKYNKTIRTGKVLGFQKMRVLSVQDTFIVAMTWKPETGQLRAKQDTIASFGIETTPIAQSNGKVLYRGPKGLFWEGLK